MKLSFFVVDAIKDELQVWNLWDVWIEIRKEADVENM
jgi:hypothetical protein